MRLHHLLLGAALALVACKDASPRPEVVDASHIDAAIDAAVDASASCFDPTTGCFKSDVCEPTTLTDFLNACTTVPCIQFDNEARLPQYNHGTLPPLP